MAFEIKTNSYEGPLEVLLDLIEARKLLVNDLALSESDALMLLADWNSGCSPPWTERELQEKVEHARRYGHHPVGAALIETRNRIVTVKVRVTR